MKLWQISFPAHFLPSQVSKHSFYNWWHTNSGIHSFNYCFVLFMIVHSMLYLKLVLSMLLDSMPYIKIPNEQLQYQNWSLLICSINFLGSVVCHYHLLKPCMPAFYIVVSSLHSIQYVIKFHIWGIKWGGITHRLPLAGQPLMYVVSM